MLIRWDQIASQAVFRASGQSPLPFVMNIYPDGATMGAEAGAGNTTSIWDIVVSIERTVL